MITNKIFTVADFSRFVGKTIDAIDCDNYDNGDVKAVTIVFTDDSSVTFGPGGTDDYCIEVIEETSAQFGIPAKVAVKAYDPEAPILEIHDDPKAPYLKLRHISNKKMISGWSRNEDGRQGAEAALIIETNRIRAYMQNKGQ